MWCSSSAYDWRRSAWVRGLPPEFLRDVLRPASHVDEQRRHLTVTLPGGRLVGIDPGHGADAAPRWAPLLLTGRVDAWPGSGAS